MAVKVDMTPANSEHDDEPGRQCKEEQAPSTPNQTACHPLIIDATTWVPSSLRESSSPPSPMPISWTPPLHHSAGASNSANLSPVSGTPHSQSSATPPHYGDHTAPHSRRHGSGYPHDAVGLPAEWICSPPIPLLADSFIGMHHASSFVDHGHTEDDHAMDTSHDELNCSLPYLGTCWSPHDHASPISAWGDSGGGTTTVSSSLSSASMSPPLGASFSASMSSEVSASQATSVGDVDSFKRRSLSLSLSAEALSPVPLETFAPLLFPLETEAIEPAGMRSTATVTTSGAEHTSGHSASHPSQSAGRTTHSVGSDSSKQVLVPIQVIMVNNNTTTTTTTTTSHNQNYNHNHNHNHNCWPVDDALKADTETTTHHSSEMAMWHSRHQNPFTTAASTGSHDDTTTTNVPRTTTSSQAAASSSSSSPSFQNVNIMQPHDGHSLFQHKTPYPAGSSRSMKSPGAHAFLPLPLPHTSLPHASSTHARPARLVHPFAASTALSGSFSSTTCSPSPLYATQLSHMSFPKTSAMRSSTSLHAPQPLYQRSVRPGSLADLSSARTIAPPPPSSSNSSSSFSSTAAASSTSSTALISTLDRDARPVADVDSIELLTTLNHCYWKNGRKNLQCFPICPEHQDFYSMKMNNRKHASVGVCRGPVYCHVFLPAASPPPAASPVGSFFTSSSTAAASDTSRSSDNSNSNHNSISSKCHFPPTTTTQHMKYEFGVGATGSGGSAHEVFVLGKFERVPQQSDATPLVSLLEPPPLFTSSAEFEAFRYGCFQAVEMEEQRTTLLARKDTTKHGSGDDLTDNNDNTNNTNTNDDAEADGDGDDAHGDAKGTAMVARSTWFFLPDVWKVQPMLKKKRKATRSVPAQTFPFCFRVFVYVRDDSTTASTETTATTAVPAMVYRCLASTASSFFELYSTRTVDRVKRKYWNRPSPTGMRTSANKAARHAASTPATLAPPTSLVSPTRSVSTGLLSLPPPRLSVIDLHGGSGGGADGFRN